MSGEPTAELNKVKKPREPLENIPLASAVLVESFSNFAVAALSPDS